MAERFASNKINKIFAIRSIDFSNLGEPFSIAETFPNGQKIK